MNTITKIEAEYTLNKSDVNWNTIHNWITTGQDKNLNIELEYFTTIPEKYLTKYAKILEEIENAMPIEIEEPYYKVTTEDLRMEEQEIEKANKKVLSCVTLDEDENIIGLNRVFIKNFDLKTIRQWQIGVVKEHQGKGIAKWMKADMYKKLFEEYPQLESIGSDTHPSNKAIINIMEQVGFKYLYTTKE
ncbi:MAG: GNAT family N-acetyltransferase [Candidatus Delongbacteria bacterium]|jgi:RimJ/RimL family protein N-acetyltransferase|nr:GNAT family N-acetyltransferase [Candidatus Delongbacteria bacterium]